MYICKCHIATATRNVSLRAHSRLDVHQQHNSERPTQTSVLLLTDQYVPVPHNIPRHHRWLIASSRVTVPARQRLV